MITGFAIRNFKNLIPSFLSTLDPDSERAAPPEALRSRDWIERFQSLLL
jgi:hypothetical protein